MTLMCFAATSPGRTSSPLRTSLRSLQAVRNSRSLETDDCHPDDQTTYPSPGLDLFPHIKYPEISSANRDTSSTLIAMKNSRCVPGGSSARMGMSCWSSSLSAASMNSNGSLHSVRDSSVQIPTMKRLQRSQSLSPCRIPHPARKYLSVHGRVFATPERSTTVAWGRHMPSTQRWKVSLVNSW